MTVKPHPVTATTIVGVDGSPASARALEWAAARVAARGGALHVVCVVDLAFGAALYGSRFDPAANARAIVDGAERLAHRHHPGIAMTSESIDGRPGRELVRLSGSAGLLVVGTDKGPGKPGPRVGTLPLTLAANARCPVAVIPDPGPMPRHDVVVGIDATPEAQSALALAVREASWADADVIAVHAWNVPEVFQREVAPDVRPDPRFEEAQRQIVVDAVQALGPTGSVRVVPEVIRANPASALIERARTAELLVVGTRGRGRFRSAVLGSVSHDVLSNITSPVIVVGEEADELTDDLDAEDE